MWFLFGFITLISFSIYFGYKKLNASWSGIQEVTVDHAYQYKINRGRYGIHEILIGTKCQPGYDFSFKQETGIDRFFKFIGLSSEYQSGHGDFDKQVYIVSDQKQLHIQLSTNKNIIDSALKIFELAELNQCKLKEIRIQSGRIWIRLKPTGTFDKDNATENVTDLADYVIPLLSTISDELQQLPVRTTAMWRDPYVIKAAVLLAISTGLAVNGLVQFFRLKWTKVPFTLDSNQLLNDAIYLGIAISIILILIAIFVLGRSARTHLILIELVLIGSLGSISTSFASLRDLNMELDSSSASQFEVKVNRTRISRSSKSRSYYVVTENWNQKGNYIHIEVSRKFYKSVNRGDTLLIKQKPGYFKYRWIKGLEKIDKS